MINATPTLPTQNSNNSAVKPVVGATVGTIGVAAAASPVQAPTTPPSFDSVVAKIQSTPTTPSAPPKPMASPAGGTPPTLSSKFSNTSSTTNTPANPFKTQQKKSSKGKWILGVIVLILLAIGGIIGFIMMNQTQDVRQQASVGVATPGCGTTCTTNANCPAAHTCSANKCVLTACMQAGAQCDENKCVQTNVAACSLNFVALPAGNMDCQNVAFRDEFSNSPGNYQLIQQQTSFVPGDVVVFRINLTNNTGQAQSISVSDVLTQNNLQNVDFMDSNCGSTAYDATTRTLTCPGVTVNASSTVARIFRVRVKTNTATGTAITNTATATAGETTATCQAQITISNTATNPSPSPTPSVAPSPSPTPTTTSTTTTQTVVGCDRTCVTNADCASLNHVCFETGYGRRCRLESNPISTSCAAATTATTQTATQQTVTQQQQAAQTAAAQQPVEPKQLPVAGTQDTIKYVIGGAAAFIMGAIALLYL